LFIPHLLEPRNIFDKTKCVDKCPLKDDLASFEGVEERSRYNSRPCDLLLSI